MGKTCTWFDLITEGWPDGTFQSDHFLQSLSFLPSPNTWSPGVRIKSYFDLVVCVFFHQLLSSDQWWMMCFQVLRWAVIKHWFLRYLRYEEGARRWGAVRVVFFMWPQLICCLGLILLFLPETPLSVVVRVLDERSRGIRFKPRPATPLGIPANGSFTTIPKASPSENLILCLCRVGG